MTRFDPSGPLRGSLRPPADKSISHRAALIAAMGEGETTIEGYLDAADTRSTLGAVAALGARVETGADLAPLSCGSTASACAAPRSAAIDVGNAGTLLRLLPGWLAGQDGGQWTLDGDDSIRQRPVDRVAIPLREMGADSALPRGAAAAAGDRRHGVARHRVRAAGRQRPGQVLCSLRGPAGGGGDPRGRAAADPRPHASAC